MASVASAIDRPTAERLRDNGIPVLEGTRSGLAALGHLVRWPLPVDPPQPSRTPRPIPEGASAFELLAAYGIPVVQSRNAHSIDEALAAADELGYPVALKTLGALHKSDVGGVALNLVDEAALSLAYTVMAQSLGPSVTVQPMVHDGVEVSVGFVRDEAFGPLVVVAAGGTLVELLADRVIACPPVSRRGALQLLDGLHIAPLLGGWRGAAGRRHRRAGRCRRRIRRDGRGTRRRARRRGGEPGDRITRRCDRRRRARGCPAYLVVVGAAVGSTDSPA